MNLKKILVFLFLNVFFILKLFSLNTSALSFNPGFEPQSKAVYLLNLDTDTTVYTKNADLKVEPASTTKIMTYIVTVENIANIDSTNITVSDRLIDDLQGTDSSLSDIQKGETLSVTELLHCMMISSGNDASVVLADFVGEGSIENFVQKMNQKAIDLGCTNTHFENPCGLHDPNHYTTASDLCKIAKYAMGLPKFMEITSKTYHTIPATNKQEERTINTTNMMMLQYYENYYYKYTKGIKTGWHDQAGYCIVTSATADGYTYLCVAMGAPFDAETNGSMLDSKQLYRWAFTTFELKPIIDVKKPVDEVRLNLVWNKDTMLLMPEKNISFLLPKDVQSNSITVTSVKKPDSVNAPVNKGDIIGNATLSYANQELSTINLVANEDVKRSNLLYFLQLFKNTVHSVWFILAIAAFVILFFVYLILSAIYKKKNKAEIRRYNNSRKKIRKL